MIGIGHKFSRRISWNASTYRNYHLSSFYTQSYSLDLKLCFQNSAPPGAQTLAQEQEQRERLLYEAQPKKRILNREVSMSRVFKPKAVVSKLGTKKPAPKVEPKPKKLDLGVTLVEETPEKPRVLSASLSTTSGSLAFGKPKFGFFTIQRQRKDSGETGSSLAPVDDADDDEEEWIMDSSPDIVLLNPSSKRHGDEMDEEEDEDELMMTTPSKPSRSGRDQRGDNISSMAQYCVRIVKIENSDRIRVTLLRIFCDEKCRYACDGDSQCPRYTDFNSHFESHEG